MYACERETVNTCVCKYLKIKEENSLMSFLTTHIPNKVPMRKMKTPPPIPPARCHIRVVFSFSSLLFSSASIQKAKQDHKTIKSPPSSCFTVFFINYSPASFSNIRFRIDLAQTKNALSPFGLKRTEIFLP